MEKEKQEEGFCRPDNAVTSALKNVCVQVCNSVCQCVSVCVCVSASENQWDQRWRRMKELSLCSFFSSGEQTMLLYSSPALVK